MEDHEVTANSEIEEQGSDQIPRQYLTGSEFIITDEHC